jgi:hypothetical protein
LDSKASKVFIFAPFYDHWELQSMSAEIHARCLNQSEEVILLDCQEDFRFCLVNPFLLPEKCSACRNDRAKYDEVIQTVSESRKINTSRIPFLDLNEAEKKIINEYCQKDFPDKKSLENTFFEDFEVGLGVSCSLIYHLQDPSPSMSAHKKLISLMMYDALMTYFSLKRQIARHNPQKMYIFNGRFAVTRAALRAAQSAGLEVFCYDDVSYKEKRFGLSPGGAIQSLDFHKQNLQTYKHQHASNVENRTAATNWYEERFKRGSDYTKTHKLGLVPAGWLNSKKLKLSLFISSEDEIETFPEYRMAGYRNQLDFLSQMFTHRGLMDRITLCIRTHPNLRTMKNEQTQGLIELERKNPEVLFIRPGDPVSSYELIEKSDAVLTYTSTVGIEAAYVGKPCIVFGVALYEDLPAILKITSVEELYQTILRIGTGWRPDPAQLKESALVFSGSFIRTNGLPMMYYHKEGADRGFFKNSEGKIVAVAPSIIPSLSTKIAQDPRMLFKIFMLRSYFISILQRWLVKRFDFPYLRFLHFKLRVTSWQNKQGSS